MRKLSLILAFTTIVAVVFSGGAAAKEAGVELSSAPSGLGPGDPWTGTLYVISPEREMLRQARPSITIRHLEDGFTRTFRAQPVSTAAPRGESREYTFRVVFPEPGRYRYTATDGVTDRVWEFVPVLIESAPLAGGPVAGGGDDTFAALPLLLGLGGLALVGAGVLVYRRRPGRAREPVAQ